MNQVKYIIDFHNPSNVKDPKTIFHNDRLQLDFEVERIMKSIQVSLEILESQHLPIVLDKPEFWRNIYIPLSEYIILKVNSLFGSNDDITVNRFINFISKNRSYIFDEKFDPEYTILDSIFLEHKNKVTRKFKKIKNDVYGIRNNYIAHCNRENDEYTVTLYELMEVVYAMQYILKKLQYYSDKAQIELMSSIELHKHQNPPNSLIEINNKYKSC